MGSFFTNVQVFLGDRDPAEARRAIVEAVRADALAGGFVEVDAEPGADRTVVIGPATGGRFVPVYDEATEDQNLQRLEGLAADLSRALATAAVAVLVHDSDVLEIRLVQRGERAAAWSSWPDYFDGKKKRKRAAFDPAPFHDLLAPGRTAEELAAACNQEKLFAEAALAALAEILGMDRAASTVGYRYLDHLPGPTEERLTLRFRAKERPAHERDAEGPPRFTLGGHNPRLELSEGDPLSVHVQVQSMGGAARGVVVSVWGSAIEGGLCEATRVRLLVGRANVGETREQPLQDGTAGSGPIRFARFDDLDVPAGLGGTGFPALDGGNMHRAMDAFFDRQIHAFVEGTVKRAGVGTLGIGVVPLANLDEGAAGHETALSIGGAPRRPLRAPPSTESHRLRPLVTPTKLFAFVSLGAAPETSAAVAAAAIERWGTKLAERGEGRYETAIFGADAAARPKTGSRKSAGIFTGKWWRDLKATLASCRVFTGSLRRGESDGEDPVPIAGGFSLASTYFGVQTKDDGPLPHLGLWMDLDGVRDDEARAAEALLVTLAGEAMDRGDGLQAIVGRWAHAPEGAHTAYEQACGASGSVTVYRSWCSRYLRGVTGRALWLGPDLLARLGDTGALEAVATVTKAGRGVRVELRDEAQLDALEQALAPLLPDASIWQSAEMALHAPR